MNGLSQTNSPALYSVPLILILPFIVYIHLSLLMPGLDAGLHMYGALLITKGHFPYLELWNNKPPLIYIIGTFGFLLKSNPFLGVRILEILTFFLNLFLLFRVVKITGLGNPLIYLLTFSVIYLVVWDGGFLTETFCLPIILTALLLWIKRIKHYELVCSLLFILSFLLKQNAAVIIGAIILLDIFTDFRRTNKTRKVASYFYAITVYLAILLFILYSSPLWPDFLEQVFIYNSVHVAKPSLASLLKNHLLQNSFLSIKGISAIMILNIFVLVVTIRYYFAYRKGHVFTTIDYMLGAATFIYLFSYPFIFISGKSYPHYFMLLMPPATLIIGYYAHKTLIAKIALLAIMTVGINQTITAIGFNKKRTQNTKQIAAILKENTPENEFIHVVGFGNQYIYSLADRLSNTKFLLPLFENKGYSEEYKKTIAKDFEHLPIFIVFNKISYRQQDTTNFYVQIINRVLGKYAPVFENEQYKVYKLSQQLE